LGLPPNARQYFAQKHMEAASSHLSMVEANLFKEGQEDRRQFEKFYNNLALFSGGTIALSITYLGYLKTLGKPLHHQWLLTAGWIALFVCLLFSLIYVLVNLHYSHHFREREWAEARKRKFETEVEEIQDMGVVNIQTPEELAAFQNPRREVARECAAVAQRHKKLQDRYYYIWLWAGRIAQLGFAIGIGMLLGFAILNTQDRQSRAPTPFEDENWSFHGQMKVDISAS
jgi:hypothetical protein